MAYRMSLQNAFLRDEALSMDGYVRVGDLTENAIEITDPDAQVPSSASAVKSAQQARNYAAAQYGAATMVANAAVQGTSAQQANIQRAKDLATQAGNLYISVYNQAGSPIFSVSALVQQLQQADALLAQTGKYVALPSSIGPFTPQKITATPLVIGGGFLLLLLYLGRIKLDSAVDRATTRKKRA